MKIIGICGSHRDGNSDWMVKKVLEGSKNKGAETEIIFLRNLNIKFCDGCDSCFKTGRGCHIKDDMQELYKKLLKADAIILGTPNYFKNVSAIMKNFMDRTNAIASPPRLKNKKAIGLCVGGQKLSNTAYCERILKEFFKDHKMKIVGMIKTRADKPQEICSNKPIEKSLIKLGRKIVNRLEM